MADVDYAFIAKAQILASHAHANLDKDWGPFQSKDAALQSMPNLSVRKAGKKFGVVSTVGGLTTIEEYMFTKDNATDNDVVKLVLSSDDVTGTYDYTIGRTTSEQLSEAIGANKIITIGTYIASVGRVGTSSSGYYVVCYTDEDGVFHRIVHGPSTSSVGTETTKEFAEVETINSISELGLSGVIGGIKKYQGNTMLDLGGVSGSGTLGNAIKHLISLGVHIDADDTNNVFSIKNINNDTIGSITLGTNATNGAAELTFVAGSNQFTATLPNLDYDSSRQMLKYIDADGDDHDLIRLSNLQIKTVFDYNTYEGDAPTSVATNPYTIGDLALVEKQDTSTTPATVYYDLTVVQSVTAGTPNDTIQWQPLGSINNVSLVADQVAFDNSTNGFNATDVQGAIEEVNEKVGQGGGLNKSAVKMLCDILQKSVYTDDQFAEIEQLRAVLNQNATIVSMPIITQSGRVVSMSCSTSGARIYYTLDGTEPTINSTQYAQPITLNNDYTIKAIAIKDSEEESSLITVYEYAVPRNVQKPVISVSGSTATLSCETVGASIYYTLNGDTPTTESTAYTTGDTITLSSPTTLKAVAYKDNEYSLVAEYSYSVGEAVESNANWSSIDQQSSNYIMQAPPLFNNTVRVNEIDVKTAGFGSFYGTIYPKLYKVTIEEGVITQTEVIGICPLTTAKGSNVITTFKDGSPLDFELAPNQTIAFGNCTVTSGKTPKIYFTNGTLNKEVWVYTVNNDTVNKSRAIASATASINIKGIKINS